MTVSKRFIEAFLRGEVTKGGMAEAGWFEIGTLAEGFPVFVADIGPEEQP